MTSRIRCTRCKRFRNPVILNLNGVCFSCLVWPAPQIHVTPSPRLRRSSQRQQAECSCGYILYSSHSRSLHKRRGHRMIKYERIARADVGRVGRPSRAPAQP